MTAVLLGLGAAVAFGISDFYAGVLSRRIHFVTVGLIAQASSSVIVLGALPWAGGAGPSAVSLSWGAASGLGSALGSLALYRGLSRGQMSVVGPLSAVGAAALPALLGMATGERPSPPALAGVLVALPAIWLVATPSDQAGATPGGGSARGAVADGLLAGVGFALLFVGLDQAGEGSGLWPVAAGQVASVVVILTVVAVLWRRPSPGGEGAPAVPRRQPGSGRAVAVGALSVTATLLYFFATHSGFLTIAAVLTSLYPGVTVLLATLLLGERISPLQRAGLALCAVAVTAIVVG